MQVQFGKIPPFLKSYDQFCNWKYELRKGEQKKVPYTPGTARRADVSNPATFAAFDAAASATGFDGIGIRVSGRLVGIDFDIENKHTHHLLALFAVPIEQLLHTQRSSSNNRLQIS